MGKRQNLKLVLIHCAFPLMIGGVLYILFRSTSLRMFNWFGMLGLENPIQVSRSFVLHFKNDIPSWVYFSLPDGLWTYSFTSSIVIFWKADAKQTSIWLLIPFLFAIVLEVFQWFHLFPGTFDFLDLLFSTIGLLLSKTVVTKKINENEKHAL